MGGTFDSDMPGTFESDTGGTFNPLLSAAYRDRFPLKVRGQGAGLEQTGAAAGLLCVRSSESVERLRRPQSRRRVAVRAEVPWAAKVPRGLVPSWRDQLGTRA